MTPRSRRSAVILAGLGCAITAMIAWSQTWFAVTLTAQSEAERALEVAGDISAPAVAALALASAAGFAAIAISGRFFRTVLALLEIILGASILLSTILALVSPVASVASAVTDATGLAGASAVTQLVASITATAWPYVSLCAGAALALVGVFILITGHSWPQSGRRYEPVHFEPAHGVTKSASDTAVFDWDALSGGSDPTAR